MINITVGLNENLMNVIWNAFRFSQLNYLTSKSIFFLSFYGLPYLFHLFSQPSCAGYLCLAFLQT